jgi:hypothetical protein
MESRQNKDLVMPMVDARGLRDELAKILVDQYDTRKEQKDAVIQVEVKGGSFT